MHLYIILFTYLTLITMTVKGSPIHRNSEALTTESFIQIVSDLDTFQLGNCSLSSIKTALPLNATAPELPCPSPGLSLKYITLGRGTQNYTCSSSNASAAPVAIGARATLFDASCVAASYSNVFYELPEISSTVPVDTMFFLAVVLGRLAPSKTHHGLIIGEHYFTDLTTPFFDFRLGGGSEWIATKKNASVAVSRVQDVPWLKLGVKEGQGIKEVYRVNTVGGSPPSSCADQASSFEVEYAAEYWFYG